MILAEKYVVRIGGKLYLTSKLYALYPSTGSITEAKLFNNEYEASNAAKWARTGEVVKITISDDEIDNTEVEMLKASNIQLQKERDDARKDLREALEIIKELTEVNNGK